MTPRALITGVCGGIGRATAAILAEDGWSVAGIDLASARIPAHVEPYYACDLGNAQEVRAAVAELSADRLDLLVACAAVQPAGSLRTATVEEWDRAFDVNVRSVFLAVGEARNALKSARGSIVAIGSVHSFATSGGRTAYVASKGALAAMMRSAALELAADGIRVNMVVPGAIQTAMLRAGFESSGKSLSDVAARTPLGRIGSPSDVAHAIRFLASAEAGFITGQSIVVDGGALALLSTET